jgi:hypothetical protein
MNREHLIVFVTNSLWNEPHRGRHHYANVLSGTHKVLRVNRQICLGENSTSPIGLEKIHGNLLVLHTGRAILPERINNHLNWSNHVRLALLLRTITAIGYPDIIWIHDYKATQFARHFRGSAITLYFCNDYFGEFAYKRYEAQLASLVDCVFCTAPRLQERLSKFSPNVAFVPHGVWPSLTPPEFQKKAKPSIVGYIGTLRNVIDVPFLHKLVTHTDLELYLAGPIIECSKEREEEFSALFRSDRVTLLSAKK